MERKRIYLCLAHMSEDGMEQKYVKEAFDTNWVVPLGPNVNGFEKDLEEFVDPTPALPEGEGAKKRVVALSAGTAAVHLGLLAAGVKAGDEVIVQSFTFCASTHPVTYLGATPVLVDSEPDTWNIDPELLEVAIKDRKAKTGKYPAAIVPVALYGMPYKADRIMEIANKYGIPVVEDAAEGFGSRYKGQVLGTFGKYGVLSFNGNKMITTSGGGALITANDDEWREIMMYATQYRESYPYYQHEGRRYNGSYPVLMSVLNYGYLWSEIRVKGGAYGCGFSARSSGILFLYSYRDPKPARSLEVIRNTPAYLQRFCSEQPDLTGFILGAVSDYDPLRGAEGKISAAEARWILGITQKEILTRYQQLLHTTVDDLLALIPALEELVADNAVCVVAGKPLLEACELDQTVAV